MVGSFFIFFLLNKKWLGVGTCYGREDIKIFKKHVLFPELQQDD